MVEWARINTPGVNGKSETDKFIDYWRAKSGRDAAKLDWIGTWRNWMRTASERSTKTNGATRPLSRIGYVVPAPPRDIADDPEAVAAFHHANLAEWDRAHA